MTRISLLLIILSGCGELSADVTDMSPDGPRDVRQEQVPQDVSKPAQGSVPPGFYQRGCQWDNPACGPTPGSLDPLSDPQIDRTGER